jgi:hypothetical protein
VAAVVSAALQRIGFLDATVQKPANGICLAPRARCHL